MRLQSLGKTATVRVLSLIATMLEAQNVCTACRLLSRHARVTPEAEKLLPQHGELHPLDANEDKLW
jgi:hypothetical protein